MPLGRREIPIENNLRSDGDLACSGGSSSDSPLEGSGFEPSVPPEGDGPGERSRGRPLSSARRPVLNDLSSLSVRDLLSATAERPFARAGPMVRIHFPKRRVYVHANQLIGARVAAADRAAGALW